MRKDLSIVSERKAASEFGAEIGIKWPSLNVVFVVFVCSKACGVSANSLSG